MTDEFTTAGPGAAQGGATGPKLGLKLLHRHPLPTGALSAALRSDGSRLYAACMDGIYEVETESGAAKRIYQHDSYGSGVALSNDQNVLVSAGYDGALIWYDLAVGKQIRKEKAHDFWSWQMAGSPDGNLIASATGRYEVGGYKYEPAPEREPSVKLFDAKSGRLVRSLMHVPPVQSVTFSPDGKLVAAGNLMGEIRVWDTTTGARMAGWTTGAFTSWGIIKSHCYIGGVFALSFTRDGEHLILAGMGPMTDPMAGNGRQLWQRFAWKETPARLVGETRSGESGEGLMEAIAVHPGGGHFVMGGRLRGGAWNVALFDTATGALQHSLKTDSRVTRALYSSDGKRLILSGAKRQPNFKDGAIAPFGHVDIYELT